MSTTGSPPAFTLPTIDLSSTLPFYLHALAPLHYTLHSSTALSAVLASFPPSELHPNALPPTLILTQSASQALKTPPSTIRLPAATRSAVRAFFAAALSAGGRPSSPPRYRAPDSPAFGAAVRDPEGNALAVEAGAPERERRGSAGESAAGSGARSAGEARSRRGSAPAGVPLAREDLGLVVGVVRGLAGPLMREVRRVDARISEKAMIGTVLGAAAGAALAYAMCKSEEESGRREIAFARAAAAVRERRERDRVETVVDEGRAERRSSAPPVEEVLVDAEPLPPLSRAYDLPSYESVMLDDKLARDEPVPASRLSVVRSKTWHAEPPVDNGNDNIGAEEYYHSHRSSKSRSSKPRSTRSRRNSREERSDKTALTLLPVPEPYYVEGLEDSRTLVPNDSVSCAGSRKRSSRSAKYRRNSRYEYPEQSYWFGEARSDARIGFSLPFRERSGDFRRRAFISSAW